MNLNSLDLESDESVSDKGGRLEGSYSNYLSDDEASHAKSDLDTQIRPFR